MLIRVMLGSPVCCVCHGWTGVYGELQSDPHTHLYRVKHAGEGADSPFSSHSQSLSTNQAEGPHAIHYVPQSVCLTVCLCLDSPGGVHVAEPVLGPASDPEHPALHCGRQRRELVLHAGPAEVGAMATLIRDAEYVCQLRLYSTAPWSAYTEHARVAWVGMVHAELVCT